MAGIQHPRLRPSRILFRYHGVCTDHRPRRRHRRPRRSRRLLLPQESLPRANSRLQRIQLHRHGKRNPNWHPPRHRRPLLRHGLAAHRRHPPIPPTPLPPSIRRNVDRMRHGLLLRTAPRSHRPLRILPPHPLSHLRERTNGQVPLGGHRGCHRILRWDGRGVFARAELFGRSGGDRRRDVEFGWVWFGGECDQFGVRDGTEHVECGVSPREVVERWEVGG
mmetsp:Transcript_22836/g.47854  ORF Transcript_22836/g.47854 Transcript_22836/m.47854 type:complete len:221 (-) Transcript_22836:469-1131(-)